MTALRTLTIVFTDVVGSTELFDGHPEGGAVQLLLTHFATMQRQVDHHGGHVVKTLGDGVMASFLSATSAIECAVAMQRMVVAAHRDTTPGLWIRVGISSGDTRLDEDDCHGVPVVEASRLCGQAGSGQVLLSESTRLLASDYEPLEEIGMRQLKGLSEPRRIWEATWSADTPAKLRVVLADDAVLLRAGIARVLTVAGIEVVGQAGDAAELERLVADLHPDLAIVDVRMPPTYSTEGVDAAARIRCQHPDTAVLVLTQDPLPLHAARLQAASPTGVGYLLKERVSDLHEFADLVRHVAAGGNAIDDDLRETGARK